MVFIKLFWFLDDAVSLAKSVETEGDAETAFTSDVENSVYVEFEDVVEEM